MDEWCYIEVDGKAIKARKGSNVLDACLSAGIYIPNLCSHPAIKSIGACRLCLVEIAGMEEPVTSCTLEVEDGMVVTTSSEKIKTLRRVAMELILSEHPEDCSSCPKYGNCILQSVFQYIEAGNGRFRSIEKLIPPVKDNPLLIHDEYRCIKCGRCIRVCSDVRGVGVLKYYKDENGDMLVGTGRTLLKDTDCRFCGACAEICPTGAIRDKEDIIDKSKPRFESYVPCREACPAHIDIPDFIRCIKNGEGELAGRIIREKVILPKTLGYVCTHYCEDVCRRGYVNESVSICRLKLVSDTSSRWDDVVCKNAFTGFKVAVIGAGPAGLASAFRLVQYGCKVTVYEKMPQAGGMLRYGIPEFRLPVDVLENEISAIEDFGVEIKVACAELNPSKLLSLGFDAVVIATGTHKGIVLSIPGHDLKGVIRNTDLLRSARMNNLMPLAAPVVVLGGGSVAFDCALTAIRNGIDDVTVVCVEPYDKMRATKEEISEAERAGIKIINEHTFIRINGCGTVSSVTIVPIISAGKSETGGLKIDYDESSSYDVPAVNVIFSVGQKPEDTASFGVSLVNNDYIAVDDACHTSMKGVFAAGDVVTGTRSVIDAIVSGKKAADGVAKYLCIHPLQEEDVHCSHSARIGTVENFSSLKRRDLSAHSSRCDFEHESIRCLQCDLRLDIDHQKFWTDFRKGGASDE